MNTRQSRIIIPALLVVFVGAFSPAAANGVLNPWQQPSVETPTTAPQPPAQPDAKPQWWKWLRFAGGGR